MNLNIHSMNLVTPIFTFLVSVLLELYHLMNWISLYNLYTKLLPELNEEDMPVI